MDVSLSFSVSRNGARVSATSYRCGLIRFHNHEDNNQNRRFHQRIRRKALAEMRQHPGGIVTHLAMFAKILTGRLAPFR
jgi:hypothetical protein